MESSENIGLNIPKHIAVIMDGNGRWARSRGLPRLEGHRQGAKAVRRTVEECRRLGVRYLTLYTFSTENWKRSGAEVAGLMKLLERYLESEQKTLLENGIRLRAIGDLSKLPFSTRSSLYKCCDATADQRGMDLILAISYGGREEIVQAVKTIAAKIEAGEKSVNDIDTDLVERSLWTAGMPDPDLLIRTSGEQRISNFLLWQLAYSEIVVINELWPEFDEEVLGRCISEYSKRERRFGLTSDQLSDPELNSDKDHRGKAIA